MNTWKKLFVLFILFVSGVFAVQGVDPKRRNCLSLHDSVWNLHAHDGCGNYEAHLEIKALKPKTLTLSINKPTRNHVLSGRQVTYTFGDCVLYILVVKSKGGYTHFSFGDDVKSVFGMDTKLKLSKDGIRAFYNDELKKTLSCKPFVDVYYGTFIDFKHATDWEDINVALYFEKGVEVSIIEQTPTTTKKSLVPTPKIGDEESKNPPKPTPKPIPTPTPDSKISPNPTNGGSSTKSSNTVKEKDGNKDKKELLMEVLIGAGIGGTLFLIIIIVMICFSVYERKKRANEEDQSRFGESTQSVLPGPVKAKSAT